MEIDLETQAIHYSAMSHINGIRLENRWRPIRSLEDKQPSVRSLRLTYLLFVLPVILTAQSISDLESKVDRFRSDASSIYRLDDEARQKIWEAYCGELDPGSKQRDARFAAEIGLTFQQREQGLVYP